MSTLSMAIQGKRWELASLCLLIGVVEAAAALPPDAVEGLMQVLAGLPGPATSAERGRYQEGARRGRRR